MTNNTASNSNFEPAAISLVSSANIYLFDTYVDEANGARTSALPTNCILKIKTTKGQAILSANDGFVFILDI